MEMEPNWSRTIRVWWAYLWRNLIAIVVAMIIAGVVGFIMGIVLGAMGVPTNVIQMVATPVGGVIGILISIVPMKLILRKNFGEFRLVMLRNEQ